MGTRADGDLVHCCGHQRHVIELRGGHQPLRMVRCSLCGDREWRLGQEAVAADAAFAVLADAYQAVPGQARAARDRAATRSAARNAARTAARTEARTGARTGARTADRTAARAPSPAAPVRPATARPAVDRSDLAALLEGWSVLGAAG